MVTFDNIATTAIRELNNSYARLSKATSTLSSGRRVDNPVGVAISGRIGSDIAIIQQEISDTNLDISKHQSAEGALNTVAPALARMQQLAVQAKAEVYSDEQRVGLAEEYQQLAELVQSTIETTEFNGNSLLTGDNAIVSLDFSDAAAIDLTSPPEDALVTIAAAVVDATAAQATVGAKINSLNSQVASLDSQRTVLVESQSAIDSADLAMTVAESIRAQLQAMVSIAVVSRASELNETALSLLDVDK